MSSTETQIVTPGFRRCEASRPRTSAFRVEGHYAKSGVTYPRDDMYEADTQDVDFMRLKGIAEEEFVAQIIALEFEANHEANH